MWLYSDVSAMVNDVILESVVFRNHQELALKLNT